MAELNCRRRLALATSRGLLASAMGASSSARVRARESSSGSACVAEMRSTTRSASASVVTSVSGSMPMSHPDQRHSCM